MTTEAVIIKPSTDPFAWVRELNPGIAPAEQPAPYHRFALRVPMRQEGKAPFLPLARGRHTSFYVNAFEPGMGERNLHAHDDDALWTVLAGNVTFGTEGDREVARLGQNQGLLIPTGTPYRYENTGDGLLIMVRAAGRTDLVEASAGFPEGTRPGGVEPFAWRPNLWLSDDQAEPAAPFHAFDVRFPLRGEAADQKPWRPLMRGQHISVHASNLEPGRGEVNLHSHDDEAIWFVLYGQVTFWGWKDDREIGTLHPHDGIVIPKNAPYRYQNTGDGYLVMLRYGGRADGVPPLPSGA